MTALIADRNSKKNPVIWVFVLENEQLRTNPAPLAFSGSSQCFNSEGLFLRNQSKDLPELASKLISVIAWVK
jgi:hypothetical protein